MTYFDSALRLQGDRIDLQPIGPADREGLFAAASDPATWAQHPASDRWQRDVFDPYFDFLLEAGGTLVARDAGRIIGCSRFYAVPDQPMDIGIGFTFLATSHWGGGWNREMKALMLTHAFAHHDRVWFHIAPDNQRSQIATTRLGAVFQYDARLDLGAGAAQLKCYVMTPLGWIQGTGQPLA